MCGRFTLRTRAAIIADQFNVSLEQLGTLAERFNIAPAQSILAIRQTASGERESMRLRWGLIPCWSKDVRAKPLINARADTVADEAVFRSAFKHRRCLVPADGYYEWKSVGRVKQPYYHYLPAGSLCAFAGLWESAAIDSCALITTDASSPPSEIHDRMPVILREAHYDAWLDPDNKDWKSLLALLKPAKDGLLIAKPVRVCVNKVGYEGPACIEPAQA